MEGYAGSDFANIVVLIDRYLEDSITTVMTNNMSIVGYLVFATFSVATVTDIILISTFQSCQLQA